MNTFKNSLGDYPDLEKELMKLAQDARELGYKCTTPKLFVDNIYGNNLGYYQYATNKITIHEDFIQNGDEEEVMNTLIHELAHAVAEQNNINKKRDGSIKRIWHGDEWKKINKELGGDASRYHRGGYIKPAPVKKTMNELFTIQPTHPAERWERGTFKQWLTRGYHVVKGQKGQLSVWEFVGEEYETEQDGKTSNWGRASAVYFTPEQVEPNKKIEK